MFSEILHLLKLQEIMEFSLTFLIILSGLIVQNNSELVTIEYLRYRLCEGDAGRP